MAKVLIIDDDRAVCTMLSEFVAMSGYEVAYELTLSTGLERAEAEPFDVVFLDVCMPDGSGLETLAKIRATVSTPEVIIITGAGDADSAEIAIKNGAWDYLQKPFSLKEIILPLKRVIQYRQNLHRHTRNFSTFDSSGIIGSSPALHNCLNVLAQASCNDATVLITGETGTGKELFARALHRNSGRADHRFVIVDCAALPESLKESALFGYEKGAFTGAERDNEGLVKQADGGTLFLDEIGELSLSHQKVFLRVLQEKCFRPVGGKREIKSDFRLVAATNRDLSQMVREGTFRKDLLYRINAIAIELPPLRHHPEDIKAITLHHTSRICDRFNIESKGFSPDFFRTLCAYEWPGNVRELVNTLEWTMSIAGNEPILFPMHLPSTIRIHVTRLNISGGRKNDLPAGSTKEAVVDVVEEEGGGVMEEVSVAPVGAPLLSGGLEPALPGTREEALCEADIRYLKSLMAYTRGNIKESCRISGLGRTRLYTLMKKYNISRMGWAPESSPVEEGVEG